MNESQVIEIVDNFWQGKDKDKDKDKSKHLLTLQKALLVGLEQGKVLHFPHLRFAMNDTERAWLDPRFADLKHKNISLQPNAGTLLGVNGDLKTQAALHALVARYQIYAKQMIDTFLSPYRGKWRAAPTSLRLHCVQTRKTSWRQDDSRLHVDAFPSRPNQGDRILRVFTNLNSNAPRVWRVGEPFDDMARRFLPKIKPYRPRAAWWLAALRITKSRRSAYDHLMLYLHDLMKSDSIYQHHCPQQIIPFPPHSTWLCFSDQTSHAAMSGQFMLEQTFFLPVAAMVQPERSPLSILTRLTGRVLI